MSTEIRFEDFKPQFDEFLEVLKEAKCIDNVLIIGSWAEYIYEQTDYLKNFHPPTGTRDLDLFIRNIRAPEREKSIAECAHEHGFSSRVDYDSQVNMFVGDGDFEIEFLVGAKWKDLNENKWQPMSEIGVRATAKPDMWPMNDFFTTVNYNGLRIHIPEPEAYFTHKILINNTRGEKALSDRQKINFIFPYLDKDRLSDVISRCHTSEKSRIDAYFAAQLGYPNADYYLAQGKAPTIPNDVKDVIVQGAKEIFQAKDAYNNAKGNKESGEKEIESLRQMKNLTISNVFARYEKTGISKDDYWMLLKQAGLSSKYIAELSSAFKQEEARKQKSITKPQNPKALIKDVLQIDIPKDFKVIASTNPTLNSGTIIFAPVEKLEEHDVKYMIDLSEKNLTIMVNDHQKAQLPLSKDIGTQMVNFIDNLKAQKEMEKSKDAPLKQKPTSPCGSGDDR